MTATDRARARIAAIVPAAARENVPGLGALLAALPDDEVVARAADLGRALAAWRPTVTERTRIARSMRLQVAWRFAGDPEPLADPARLIPARDALVGAPAARTLAHRIVAAPERLAVEVAGGRLGTATHAAPVAAVATGSGAGPTSRFIALRRASLLADPSLETLLLAEIVAGSRSPRHDRQPGAPPARRGAPDSPHAAAPAAPGNTVPPPVAVVVDTSPSMTGPRRSRAAAIILALIQASWAAGRAVHLFGWRDGAIHAALTGGPIPEADHRSLERLIGDRAAGMGADTVAGVTGALDWIAEAGVAATVVVVTDLRVPRMPSTQTLRIRDLQRMNRVELHGMGVGPLPIDDPLNALDATWHWGDAPLDLRQLDASPHVPRDVPSMGARR